MIWLDKIASEAFDAELDRLFKSQNLDLPGGPGSIKVRPNLSDKGYSNIGSADYYDPTEKESTYGQAM